MSLRDGSAYIGGVKISTHIDVGWVPPSKRWPESALPEDATGRARQVARTLVLEEERLSQRIDTRRTAAFSAVTDSARDEHFSLLRKASADLAWTRAVMPA